jgi:hypothetical protein
VKNRDGPDRRPTTPPAENGNALALVLCRTWRESLELGSFNKAMVALKRLRILAARAESGNRWDWYSSERTR